MRHRRAVREALHRSGSPTGSVDKELQSLLVEAGSKDGTPQETVSAQPDGVVDAAASVTERRRESLKQPP